MWHNENFNEDDLLIKNNINLQEITILLKNMLNKINSKHESYAIYQHLIWPRYNSIANIKRLTLKYGLNINSLGMASTTNITGNTISITPEDILGYYYDSNITSQRNNMGFIIPLQIKDELGRTINLALDKHHDFIPWREGKMCSILDFIAFEKRQISNTYSLFNADIDVTHDNFSCQINKKALPFLSEREKQLHYLELSKLIKKVLVDRYKILSEEEYYKAKDINPYIEKLILQEYEKCKNEIYCDSSCWEEP